MKNPCSLGSDLLERYYDREATDEERSLVEHHLADCLACRETLALMEELRGLIKTPIEEAVEHEGFPWVWQKIQRGIQAQQKPSWREVVRSWLDSLRLLRKRVWVPAVATVAVLLFVTAQVFFKKTASYQALSVVEYVESEQYNVMVYESETEPVTVIWLFEGPEQGASTS